VIVDRYLRAAGLAAARPPGRQLMLPMVLGSYSNDEVTILPRTRDALEMLSATMFVYLAQCAEDGLCAAVMPNRTI
jgi:hypothetical protein